MIITVMGWFCLGFGVACVVVKRAKITIEAKDETPIKDNELTNAERLQQIYTTAYHLEERNEAMAEECVELLNCDPGSPQAEVARDIVWSHRTVADTARRIAEINDEERRRSLAVNRPDLHGWAQRFCHCKCIETYWEGANEVVRIRLPDDTWHEYMILATNESNEPKAFANYDDEFQAELDALSFLILERVPMRFRINWISEQERNADGS